MDQKVTTIIDAAACIGCGLCVAVCPSGTITMRNDKAEVTGSRSLACGHCEAVCPVGAIRVEALADRIDFNTFAAEEDWLAPGDFPVASLVRLMRSRRSCRNYTGKEPDRDLLEDLIKIGTTAPSGTNSQKWTFTVLASRSEVAMAGNCIAGYFKRLNRMAANPVLRLWSKLFGNDELGSYYRRYYRMMEDGLADWEQKGTDRLFHGATAAILVGSAPGASCPVEDALLASQNILLAAHAMGLGTCLIGFAVAAIKHDPAIKSKLAIPRSEDIHAVIALGYPAEKYEKVAGRKQAVVRYPFS